MVAVFVLIVSTYNIKKLMGFLVTIAKKGMYVRGTDKMTKRFDDLKESISTTDSRFNIIELDQKWTTCTICSKDTLLIYYIPMYEGKKVDTTKTDDWAGMPVCKECHDKDVSETVFDEEEGE